MNIPLMVLAAAAAMFGWERLRPGRHLPAAPGFISRAVLLNGIQAASTYLLGTRLDSWWSTHALLDLSALPLLLTVPVCYVAITFVYYWWHRVRHEVDWLWRWTHQVHHSPTRLELITSFYKHPLEIGLNAVLSSAVLFGLLGASPEAGALTVLLTGLAELFYHWNVKTPRWLGYVFQRPEMHCVHHETDRHTSNFSDLPLWDMLFGTFDNPPTFEGACGFSGGREAALWPMMRGHDVHARAPRQRRAPAPAAVVLILGTVRIASDVVDLPRLGAVAAATGASPSPKVFTAYGTYEPYSTAMTLHWRDTAGRPHGLPLTPTGPRIRGAYNRRNVLGAVVVFTPRAREQPWLAPMFEAVAHHAMCGERPLLRELGINPKTVHGSVTVSYRTREGLPPVDPVVIRCDETTEGGTHHA